MATAKDKNAATTAVVLEPPKSARPGRKPSVNAELIASLAETIAKGEWVGVPDGNGGVLGVKPDSDSEKDIAKARAKAGSLAMRHKKAIINSDANEINDPKQIKSRVWEQDGVFIFAIGPKNTEDE